MSDNSRISARAEFLRHLAVLALSLGLLFLAGCQTTPKPPSTAPAASRAAPLIAIPENAVRYEIRPDLSDIRFLVFRAGALAKLGHNHVVQAKNIEGEVYLAPDIHQSRFFIRMPVKDFQVDAVGTRVDEGEEFLAQPDDEAIAGTTRNMLGEKVLDAARYPTIEIASVAMTGPAWGIDITVRIRLHGVERELIVPTAIEYNGDKLAATAFFSIKQTDFGIAPMQVLGGAVQVADTIRIRMRIVAAKKAPRNPVNSGGNSDKRQDLPMSTSVIG